GRGALAGHRPLQLLVLRERAARAVPRLGVRGVLLAAARGRPTVREPAHRRDGQRDLYFLGAQGVGAAGGLPGGASRPWYSWLPTHRRNAGAMIPSALHRPPARRARSQAFRATVLAVVLSGVAGELPAQTRELGATGELLDGIAAIVDEGVVLKSELEQRLALVVDTLREQQAQLPFDQRRPLPPLSVLERQVLDQLILKEVQLQRARRLGIQVSDDLLNQALSQVARNLGLTLEQLPAALAAEAIDYALYREDSREDLIL